VHDEFVVWFALLASYQYLIHSHFEECSVFNFLSHQFLALSLSFVHVIFSRDLPFCNVLYKGASPILIVTFVITI
jgi:hypothetical protein